MPLFSAAQITKFSNEGENSFVVDHPCILKRISLSTVSGSPLITLPDDVKSIRRLTWKGYKLDPLPQRNFREVFQNATQTGRPFWYVFNNIGQNVIQLFPAPNESLSAGVGSLYSTDVIRTCFIVEYFQVPDFITAIIPSYIRRRLLKAYVMRGCFSVEGAGQNLGNVKYFRGRWDYLEALYGNLLDELHNKPRKLIVNGISASYYFPGNPILPIDKFGTSVDAGE
jgi:hypothetical protein